MHVLVVTPMLREPSGKARLYGKALQSIFNLRWSGQLDHFFLNGGDNYLDPSGTVTNKYQQARDVFLAGAWDAMLCAEYDMLLPADALEKLAALDTDIAYGLYVLRHERKAWNAALWITEQQFCSYSEVPMTPTFGVRKVAGVGLGCTLIKRHVVEALPFRNWRGVSNDWAFACDAQAAGYEQVCDFDVKCGHMSIVPSPHILWPDANEPDYYRTEPL